MTHVEKMRLQAALKALQGNLPRCTAPRHSEPVVSCRRRASGYGVRAGRVVSQVIRASELASSIDWRAQIASNFWQHMCAVECSECKFCVQNK